MIFDRFRGVQDVVVGEGTHFLIPWVQKPIIFDCRSRPRNIPVITGSKGGCWPRGRRTQGVQGCLGLSLWMWNRGPKAQAMEKRPETKRVPLGVTEHWDR